MIYGRLLLLLLAATAFSLVIPHTSRAQLFGIQFSVPQPASGITIVATPAVPGPRTLVHFSIESLAGSSADATWTVNGKPIDPDERTGGIDVHTGAVGEKMVVTARVEGVNGPQTATLTVIPTTIDLLIDAVSYTPPFYKGRPLAAAGTSIRAQAIPHFGSVSAPLAASAIAFTWRQDGTVVASGIGKSTVTLPAPPLFGSATITVEARSTDGIYSGSASVRLPGIDPNATLYINNPLVGIEYFHTIENGGVISDIETTLVAVPYFIDSTPRDPRLRYEWRVNGRSVAGGTENTPELTINARDASGPATIALMFSSSANFLLHADQLWHITFTPKGTLPARASGDTPSVMQ